ncbi:MAG: PAC2 family protein [Candidatus Limnocylindrales bacterium]
MRWRGFCDELIELCRELGVDSAVVLGALLADTPHTRPVPVSGSSYDAASAERYGLETSRYEGPTGITGVFQQACVQAGLPAISFWAAVPHYVSQPPSPKATLALLHRVEEVLDVPVPLGALPGAGRGVADAGRRDGRRGRRGHRVRPGPGGARPLGPAQADQR